MIFKPELVEQIVAGRKTQTRRRPTGRYIAGRDYAVQPGRGKHAVCRMLVTEVRTETLADLTVEDAVREGFEDRAAFYAYWRALYGKVAWAAEVEVITFEVV